jgi:hypothetical protein
VEQCIRRCPLTSVRPMLTLREPAATAATGARSRRRFLKHLGGLAATLLLPLPATAAVRRLLQSRHPDPRPGIDGSRVLTESELTDAPHLVALFDGIREIPHIADGIRCYCGCAQLEEYRSLLSCYEGVGMAKWCEVCQGQGRLAHGRWKEGQTLEQIRRATDARFGHGESDRTASERPRTARESPRTANQSPRTANESPRTANESPRAASESDRTATERPAAVHCHG